MSQLRKKLNPVRSLVLSIAASLHGVVCVRPAIGQQSTLMSDDRSQVVDDAGRRLGRVSARL
jgi:hypothetical protein